MNPRSLTPTMTAVLSLFLVTDILAACSSLQQHYITADVGTVLDTAVSRVRAPGIAGIYNSGGEPCFQYSVSATAWIDSGGAVVAEASNSNPGEVIVTAYGNAAVGNCYTAGISASGGDLTHPPYYAAEECWYGPPPDSGGGGCGYSGTCEQSESCPLILDLNGDGIHTTGLDDPMYFWIDLMGRPEATAWTNPDTEEAFLWMDLNHDRSAQVTELFGSRMVAPDGGYFVNGFVALIAYDRVQNGGDWDGQITRKDAIWSRLRLWVDRNHDAVSQPTEISVPASHGIVALNLSHSAQDTYDENGNELYLVSSYVRHRGGELEYRMMADVEFRYTSNY